MTNALQATDLLSLPSPDGQTHPFDPLVEGIACYSTTTLLVAIGVVFGTELVSLAPGPLNRTNSVWENSVNWDGQSYRRILIDGYGATPNRNEDAGFLPAYPLATRGLMHVTGLSPDVSLTVISHFSLVGAFIAFGYYLRRRLGDTEVSACRWTILAFGLWPTTFFFRMAYSESLFVFMTLLAFCAMERGWPMAILAWIVGLATATHLVGIGLCLPLLMHFYGQVKNAKGWLNLLWILPLTLWGLIAHFAFNGEAPAVASVLGDRGFPPIPNGEKLLALITLEPIWSVFVPASPGYWGRSGGEFAAFFSLRVASAVYWLITLVLCALGWWNSWLTSKEIAFGAFVLVGPYLFHGCESHMAGMAPISATVFPLYRVCGRLLDRLPPSFAASLLAISGFFLAIYSALFSAWHPY